MNFTVNEAPHFVAWLSVVLGGTAIYLLPSLIAIKRSHPSAVSIVFLNVFLGWTVIVYAGVLMWSLAPPPPLRT